MPIELEAKMKVQDLAEVRARLESIRAARMSEMLETNTYFDTAQRSLLTRDSGLRLRETRDLATGQRESIVTYKGPREGGDLKCREEIEFATSDSVATLALFKRLGYVPQLTFEKRRQTWKLDGCLVELDEVPLLGTFVEIEGPAQDAVMGVRNRLELSEVALVKPSYVELLMQHLQESSDSRRTVTFDDVPS